jgi:outer membrane protein
MIKAIAICIIYFSDFCIFTLQAQDNTLDQMAAKWDLQTCIDYAKKHNIQINTLRLDMESSQQDLLLSKSAKLPNLIGSASASLVNSKSVNLSVGGVQSQASVLNNFGVNSSWIIYSGGYYNYDIKQKQYAVQSANLNILQQENDITLQITQAYLNILLAKENIVYVEDLLKTSQAQMSQGQQRFDAGSIAKKDLAELQGQTATDKYNLVVAQSTHRQNMLTLKQLLQLPTDTAFNVVEPDTVIASALVPSLDEVEKTALGNRPEVKNGEIGVQIAQLDVSKARSAFYPTATVGAALATGYSKSDPYDYIKQIDNNFYQQIGLALSIPIFTRRVTKTAFEKAKIEVGEAKLSLQNTKTSLSYIVEQAYINVINAQAQYDAAVEQLKANQESYRIATEQLKVGVANMVDFLQQKNLYVQALQNYVQAKYNSALNIKIYDFYMGVPVKL